MGRKRREVKPLPTIWRLPDELWKIVKAILAELDPPAPSGRKRTDQRMALNGIIYQMRTGCQWNVPNRQRIRPSICAWTRDTTTRPGRKPPPKSPK